MLHENACGIEFCDLISVSLIRVSLKRLIEVHNFFQKKTDLPNFLSSS